MAEFDGEMTRLADPGNGIYTNIMEHVSTGNLPAPTVPFLGSFLTAIERTRVSAGCVEGRNNTIWEDRLYCECMPLHVLCSAVLARLTGKFYFFSPAHRSDHWQTKRLQRQGQCSTARRSDHSVVPEFFGPTFNCAHFSAALFLWSSSSFSRYCRQALSCGRVHPTLTNGKKVFLFNSSSLLRKVQPPQLHPLSFKFRATCRGRSGP